MIDLIYRRVYSLSIYDHAGRNYVENLVVDLITSTTIIPRCNILFPRGECLAIWVVTALKGIYSAADCQNALMASKFHH